MTKKSKHPRICLICNKGIGSKEEYVRLTEYAAGAERSTGFYHKTCFRDRFLSIRKEKERANKILDMATPIFERAKARGVIQ